MDPERRDSITDATNMESPMLLGGPAGIEVSLPSTAPVPALDLPQASYLVAHGPVMTDEQLETLRRQISVYATICNQLVEMHKASMAQQLAVMPSMMSMGQHLPYDSTSSISVFRSSARQRWTPSQSQLHILEKLFEKGNGTPNKNKIKEITAELSRHGQISETNVYNWFQNRKARAKRKQQLATQKDAESEVETDEVESPKDKRNKMEGGMPHDSQQGAAQAIAFSNLARKGNAGIMETKQYYDMAETDTKPTSLVDTGVHLDILSGHHSSTTTLVVWIDGKPWEVPSGPLDVKGSFGDTAMLVDSRGQKVITNEDGFTFQSLLPGENYTLVRVGENVRGIGVQADSEKIFPPYNQKWIY